MFSGNQEDCRQSYWTNSKRFGPVRRKHIPTGHSGRNFARLNGLAYVRLFLSIQSGNWDLRLASLKLMVPLFCAFDHPTYRKLLPQHLAACLLIYSPRRHSTKLSSGGVAVSITGRPWHSVGVDEAQEMMVNKQ